MKEGLIQICLFMLGGQWILFLQCGKRYEKITKIVLELLGISLMITTLGKSIGKMDFTDYLTKLQQNVQEFSTSEKENVTIFPSCSHRLWRTKQQKKLNLKLTIRR